MNDCLTPALKIEAFLRSPITDQNGAAWIGAERLPLALLRTVTIDGDAQGLGQPSSEGTVATLSRTLWCGKSPKPCIT